MPVMTSQILKSVDFTKTQNSRYLENKTLFLLQIKKFVNYILKVVSATFLLVCFVCLKGCTCETRENIFYFTSKAFFVLEIIKF